MRELAFDADFDAAICLCQGGFGLLGGRDEHEVFRRIARAIRPGGRLALSAFSAAFALRFLEDGESYDPATGVLHERSTVRDPDGREREFDIWTTCFTVRELELLAAGAGLVVDTVAGVAPGRYGRRAPMLEHPELLLLGETPTFRIAHRRCSLIGWASFRGPPVAFDASTARGDLQTRSHIHLESHSQEQCSCRSTT